MVTIPQCHATISKREVQSLYVYVAVHLQHIFDPTQQENRVSDAVGLYSSNKSLS